MLNRTGQMVGGIELGGTKILCAVADGDNIVSDHIRIPTGDDPDAAIAAIDSFFEAACGKANLAAVGVGSFGPLSLDGQAGDFGSITTTTKPGWSRFPLLDRLRGIFAAPVVIDTDVNCAAVAEVLYGAGRGLDHICYVTVGTGIGVGVVIDGKPFGGANHLEAGHMLVRRAPGDVRFRGICPFHDDCLEGLAAGPAMAARWSMAAETLPEGHEGWRIEADYLAQLCLNLTYTLRPQRIIIGGGVLERDGLIAMVRDQFELVLAGYDDHALGMAARDYICSPQHRSNAGLIGALASAHRLASGAWPLTGFRQAA